MAKLTDVNVWLYVVLVLALVLAVASVGSLGWLHDALHRQAVEAVARTRGEIDRQLRMDFGLSACRRFRLPICLCQDQVRAGRLWWEVRQVDEVLAGQRLARSRFL